MTFNNTFLELLKKMWRISVLRAFYSVAPFYYKKRKLRAAKLRSKEIRTYPPAVIETRSGHLLNALWPVEGLDLMRVGAERDGGYLIPVEMGEIDALFSPGVDTVSDFELYFAERGIRCYLADGSVSAPPIQHEFFEFTPKFIGDKHSDTWISFGRWIQEAGLDFSNNLALQMDIEGGEYEVFMDKSAKNLFSKFKWIAIELHDLHLIGSDEHWSKVHNLLSVLSKDFKIVHIHPNNNEATVNIGGRIIPPVIEVTFANTRLFKDEQARVRPKEIISHEFDRQNSIFMPKIDLDEIWSDFQPTF